MHKKIITIDGPSGGGKSTVSQMLATRLNYTYLDTGAMYRAVGIKIVRSGIDENNDEALNRLLTDIDLRLTTDASGTKVYIDGDDVSEAIRTAEMGMVASRVSAIPAVRRTLTALQQEMGRQGAIVAEGRDMGTVVFPDAPHKFYLDASPEERARRRHLQLQEKGETSDYQELLQQIIKRDRDDSSRALAPLKPADDAIIIDSSTMDAEAVVRFMLERINIS
ncbi:MAG: (d)CMP kinase [Desulfobulbaceae bacterium]|nr:(d)CMP kinase [Desulfobulbaceae bacterium]